jgi:hypothetical protein
MFSCFSFFDGNAFGCTDREIRLCDKSKGRPDVNASTVRWSSREAREEPGGRPGIPGRCVRRECPLSFSRFPKALIQFLEWLIMTFEGCIRR